MRHLVRKNYCLFGVRRRGKQKFLQANAASQSRSTAASLSRSRTDNTIDQTVGFRVNALDKFLLRWHFILLSRLDTHTKYLSPSTGCQAPVLREDSAPLPLAVPKTA